MKNKKEYCVYQLADSGDGRYLLHKFESKFCAENYVMRLFEKYSNGTTVTAFDIHESETQTKE